MIRSNLKKLIEPKGLSVRKVARDINYRLGSVQDMYNDQMERYPRELLTKLCVYLECNIGDLLVLDEEKTTEE
ncbi:hypothetical protein B1222_01845 [Paenibacillus larvae subsp. pulvifaciens]|uniref:Uncharacterized protein n=1 Tax=Paenibacillus larvae subsp. pulvifaciens TaxID=1477 RepID=A0A1U9YUW4_9BACL|nr:hypothetical protein B1222_01845 [Paenibacillus larvae subsp. pulvifaciens]AQZ49238.1 hypothetical protein B5S25_20260 [Paenibacillus larvae subsp. pulvifaciens]ARF70632.1 hypothetical protein B7C51_23110 [Paenibacillus larvae subsp. pulvifaciens]MBH0343560.1 hypothetical protein [Paenibacillus larvae]